MRKYLYIFKSEIMSSMQYIINILMNFMGYFIHIFIFLNLWNYIYSNPDELINGYSKFQMVWYVVITELLWSAVGGRKLCRKIVDDVKSGNIVYQINKPYSYVNYALASHLGEVLIQILIYCILGLGVGLVFLGGFPKINILELVIVIITGALATIINTLIIIGIGLLSFKIEDANPVYWLYSKVILILGTIFPIEFFPKFLQGIISKSPIYVVTYGPAKLFVDFDYKNAFLIICAQVVYLVLAYGLVSCFYKKGVKKLNVNGG